MASRVWSKRLVFIGGALALLVGLWAAYERWWPARFLIDARSVTLPDGRAVVVTQEVVGSSLSNGQFLRFQILDAANGACLHRVLPSWDFGGERLRFLGGGPRMWWAKDARVLLLDPGGAKVVAEASDLLSKNPTLRGELHSPNSRDSFSVDMAGALLVKGGDGGLYAISPETLIASPLSVLPRFAARPPISGDLLREVANGAPTAPVSPAPAEIAGPTVFSRVCYTLTQGPCGLRARSAGTVLWELGEADLGSRSVLSIESRSSRTAYLYVSNDSVLDGIFGGVWIYAVELSNGRVDWKTKL